jgi:purine-nucleoside phosphorylase
MMTRREVTEPSMEIQSAVEHIRQAISDVEPVVGIVLGSGLGALVDTMEIDGAVSYSEIPNFPSSTVEGHAGRLVLGTLSGVPVAVMQGRVHLYEGYSARQVVFPTRVLVRLGAERLVITNAAGCLNSKFKVPELMLISDHLNLSGTSPLHGPNDVALGPRFPDMSDAYDLEYRQIAREVAKEKGVVLREGVYAGLLGPAYETPAEIRMLKILGADAVGMSTVSEVIAARHMSARVIGLSCLSNMAAGISEVPLSHEDVKAAADAIQADLTKLVSGIVARIGLSA